MPSRPCPQARGRTRSSSWPPLRQAVPRGPGAGHVARELRAPRRTRLFDARARLRGDARGGCGGGAGHLRRGGRGARRARPNAGVHRERTPRGAMPRWPSLEGKRNRRTDCSAESGKRCRAAGGVWPPDLTKRISTVTSTGKTPPRGPGGTPGAFG